MPFSPGGAYVYLRHLAGDGVGYTDGGYTTLGTWTPLLFDPLADLQVVYLDARVSLTNETEMVGNFGLGYRKHLCDKGITLGAHAFYDIDAADESSFNQVGGGFEILTRRFDIHANVYVPVGRTKHHLSSSISNPRLMGNNIVFDEFRLFDTAMQGFDVEVGVPLPILDRYGFRAYAGWYRYEADQGALLTGARMSLLLQATKNVELQVTWNNDDRFGSTTLLGGTIRFGGRRNPYDNTSGCGVNVAAINGCDPCRPRSSRPMQDLLTRPVRRSDRIVVTRTNYTGTSDPARDAATKQPIRIVHVDSNAAAGGNGTVESPFSSLADAQTASQPGDIIYVYADSVFNGAASAIALQDQQRLLGEGLTYQINSCEFGQITLPRVSTGTTKPQLDTATGSAVTLADSNEISNLNITNAGTSGIAGVGVTSFDIHDVMISQSSSHGIDLGFTDVSGSFRNNMITGAGGGGLTGAGIQLLGTSFTGDFVNNMTDNNLDEGINMRVTTFTGDVTNNKAMSNGFRGIAIFSDTHTGDATGNMTNNNNGEGMWLNAEFFTGLVSNNMANDNTASGILVKGNTTFNANITNNVTNGTTGVGFEQREGLHLEGGLLTGVVDGNSANGNRVEGLWIELDGLNGDISNNTVANSFLAPGVRLNLLSSGNATGRFLNNTLSGNNGTGNELIVTHNGTGTMFLEFNGNSSSNIVAPGQFNFDLQNQSTGLFNVRILGNTGTFGTTSGVAATVVP